MNTFYDRIEMIFRNEKYTLSVSEAISQKYFDFMTNYE